MEKKLEWVAHTREEQQNWEAQVGQLKEQANKDLAAHRQEVDRLKASQEALTGQLADVAEEHQVALALAEQQGFTLTQLQTKLETVGVRQREEAALASRVEAEAAQFKAQHTEVVAVLIQQ